MKSLGNRVGLFIVIALQFIFLLCLFLILSRVDSSDSYKPSKFGATYMTMNNPYFKVLNEGIKEVIEANGDILITRDPAQDQEKQNQQIIEMIDEGVEAIFLNPVDWKAVKPALIACDEAGIPIFNVDTLVYDSSYVDSVIISDNYNAGVQCAEEVMSMLNKGDIVILDEPNIYSITERIRGFKDTINKNPNFNIVVQKAAGGELEISMEVMKDIIKSGINFDVIMGGNDPTAIGALAALEAYHMNGEVLIYGVDGSPDGKNLIRDGYLSGTSSQYPGRIGRMAAEVAYDYIRGKDIEKYIEVPVTFIDRDSLKSFDINGWE